MAQEQEPQYRAVYFQVTDGAQAEMTGGGPLLYVGMTYHIPRQDLEEAQRIFDETNDAEQAQQVIARDDINPDRLMEAVRTNGYMPVQDAILERFDTVDTETGDILVLLRVPCMMTLAQGMGGDMSEAA
ncbi:MAG: hypothetical protein ACYDCO_23220 [Armatimonadota bacterium]